MTTRQRSLLVAEDWKKIYQTFKEADFQSYDFETLRKSMIDYLRLYYPEDFNDFIESSEYIALIDLIAFLGQGLAFRTELNSRENFIDTAERRESILRLAKLINYSPKRNIPSRGLLKVTSVRTTENVFDSDGVNLSGATISWNDVSNTNWLEQFVTVMNAALVSSQRIGRPGNSSNINGIKTEEYQVNLFGNVPPVFSFSSSVEGVNMLFEMVNATSINDVNLHEGDPRPGSPFNIIYRSDKLGNGSNNTGYFTYFKQGQLGSRQISFPEAVPNSVVSVDIANINNMDVWLYKLDSNGIPSEAWTSVPAIAGNNIAYNNLSNVNRKIYQIVTKDADQIDLVFGDGVFSDIPQGDFILYYRVSAGMNYKITPDEMQAIPLSLRYLSKTGRPETLTLVCSLQYTVANSSARESNEDIKQRAPQQYYSQNRIVTGEDYNTYPFTAFSTIAKVKSVNRMSSGISRYLDVIDSTGKYSSTNIYGQDGWLYAEERVNNFTFTFLNNNDIIKVIRSRIYDILGSGETLNFYYEKFPSFTLDSLIWVQSSKDVNLSTGYFATSGQVPVQIGMAVENSTRYLRSGCLVKVTAPAGTYFDQYNVIRTGVPLADGDKIEYYASVTSVIDTGTNQGRGSFSDGTGPVTLNDIVPTGAIISRVWAPMSTVLSATIEQDMLTLINQHASFGLRFDQKDRAYKLITVDNLDKVSDFSLDHQGDDTELQLDSSWLVYFESDGEKYTVRYRQYNFVFESQIETRFYFDPTVRVFDPKTARVITDHIKVLKSNSDPDDINSSIKRDYVLKVHDVFVGTDGFRETTRIKVTYSDADRDAIPDNIDFFTKIVNPTVNANRKFVFFQKVVDSYGYESFAPIDTGVVNSLHETLDELQAEINQYVAGQLFFLTGEKVFYRLDINGGQRTLVKIPSTDMIYRIGRGNLYYQYRHNSPNNRRIDPSPNNLIDLYILTTRYSSEYTNWLKDITGKVPEPVAPSSEELRMDYGSLEYSKPVSDALLFSSARFKPLFGAKAQESLRATFKVVKNPAANVSDSEVRSRMVMAINDFFDVNNWDFGETFYFSELSAYLHQALASMVSSIVLVPNNSDLKFGSLYQVECEPDEIVVSAATVDNIEIIPALTASQLNQ